MSSLKQVRIRRVISIASSFVIAALVSLPALSIRPELFGEIYYLGLIASFVMLATWALHNSIIGPMIFSYASVEAPGIRRAIDRIVPKTNPIFRVSPRTTNTHVQVEQYLWNGWTEIHQDHQFESIGSMQLYVRDASARSQPFIGPEFTGDDLLVIEGDEDQPALSMRHADRYTERARDEADQARRSLWSLRFIYCGLAAAIVATCGYGLSVWRHQPFGGRVLPLTLEQLLMGCGLVGIVAVIAAYSYATRTTRRRWWQAVKQGTRYVRYRLVREAHEDRYFVQAYSASEWRTKSHLNGLDMASVEKSLENDVRELRRIVASNHATADARAARERLIAPFAVDGGRSEALLHQRRNEHKAQAPALIELQRDEEFEPIQQLFDAQAPQGRGDDEQQHVESRDADSLEEPRVASIGGSNVRSIRFPRDSAGGGQPGTLQYPAR